MTKKVGRDELKKLVEVALNEEININISYDNQGKITGKRDLKKALGLSNPPDYNGLAKLANKDNEKSDLSNTDFERAYASQRATPANRAADFIRTNTSSTALKADIDNIYKDSTWDQELTTRAKTQAEREAAAKAEREARAQQRAQQKAAAEAAAAAAKTAAINAAVGNLKSTAKLEDRLKQFITATQPGGALRKIQGDHGGKLEDIYKTVFEAAFPSEAERLKIQAYQRSKQDDLKLTTGQEMTPTRNLVKDAENKRLAAETEGAIKKEGYSRFVTDKVHGSRALQYFFDETEKDDGKKVIKNQNYNYTVFTTNPVEPWFLRAKGDNTSAIKTLMESDAQGDKDYLQKFRKKPNGSDKENEIFFNNFKAFKYAIEQKGISTRNSDFWKGMVKDYGELISTDPEVTPDLERTSLTSPAIMSQAAGSGKMLSSQFAMFNTFFEGTPDGSNAVDTLTARIKKLTEFSEKLYGPNAPQPPKGKSDTSVTEVVNKSNFSLETDKNNLVKMNETGNQYVDLLNKIMVLDYFNTMAKELDSGAGAYVFEAFCAYLAGGRVAGKEKGLKGGMGETDFFFDDGSSGSAKYLAAGTTFSQSVGNFVQGRKVTYVFASKKGDKPIYDKSGTITGYEAGKEVLQTDPDLIHFIDLYVVDVERKDQSEIGGEVPFAITATGQDGVEKSLAIKKNKVEFNVENFAPAGRLYLVEKNKESIMKNLGTLAQKMDDEVTNAQTSFKALVEYFTKTFKHLESAKEKVSEYSNTGTMQLGTDAISEMSNAQTEFKGVMGIIDPAEPAPVSESKKITAKHLQKLISEKFKK